MRVQEALEFMLSKKNLARDQFLAGNINPQMYIPIKALLQHEYLQNICATETAVVMAATRSTRLGIDQAQTMVRPILKSKRNVIIIRDLPVGTTEAEIRDLFSGGPHSDRLKEVKPEVNNTWFVKFGLNECQDVVLWLRSQTLRGSPVNAAIKSEHFLRGFFPIQQLPREVPPPEMGYTMPMAPAPMEYLDMTQGVPPPNFEGGMNWGAMPQVPMGPQPPGFWQPWGKRYQPPPLIFTSETTLASSSMPIVAQQASTLAPGILDNVGMPDHNKGKDKWGKSKGRGGGWEDWSKDKGGKGGKSSWGYPAEDARDRWKGGKKGVHEGRERADGKTRLPPRVIEQEAASSGNAAPRDRKSVV